MDEHEECGQLYAQKREKFDEGREGLGRDDEHDELVVQTPGAAWNCADYGRLELSF